MSKNNKCAFGSTGRPLKLKENWINERYYRYQALDAPGLGRDSQLCRHKLLSAIDLFDFDHILPFLCRRRPIVLVILRSGKKTAPLSMIAVVVVGVVGVLVGLLQLSNEELELGVVKLG